MKNYVMVMIVKYYKSVYIIVFDSAKVNELNFQ